MNYYISALFSTIISFLVFYYQWGRDYEMVRNKIFIYTLLIASLLSLIVNVFVKRPIFLQIFKIFNINENISLWPLWFLPFALIIGAFAEEGIKVLLILLQRSFINGKIEIYFLGLLVGFGFGVGEIWYLANKFVKSNPQYNYGINNLFLLLLGFGAERLLAVFFHTTLSGIIGNGFRINKSIKYFVLAVLLHSLVNFPAGLYQMGKIPLIIAGVLVLTIICWIMFEIFIEIDEVYVKEIHSVSEESRIFYEKK